MNREFLLRKSRFLLEVLVVLIVLCLAFSIFMANWNGTDKDFDEIVKLFESQSRTPKGTTFWATERTGPPVVMIHGLFGSKYSFEAAVPFLRQQFQLIAYDVKGFGYTLPEGQMNLPGQVQQLKEFLDEIKYQKVNLVGHSMGAGIATAFAALYPNRVAKLILVSPVDIFAPEKDTSRETSMKDVAFSFLRSSLGQKLMPLVAGRGTVRMMLNRLVQKRGIVTEARVLNYTYPMQRPGYWPVTAEVLEKPTAEYLATLKKALSVQPYSVGVLWGFNDTWLAPQGERICSYFKNCVSDTIPDAGHLPQEEQPQKFAEKLSDLLGS